ncbi:DNA polymerase III subunit gamma/tau [Sulfurospirillum sp. 1612]|uniref:DNA polymerase III subunit gamma/tau n=1 Tax=Sulfurospirillum sp. 1612 TaxID=3094835 RepID=UPI002F94F1B2
MSQVLALKYRPKSFDQLIGQRSVTQTLSLALNQDRLSHAYLFSGLRGSGKTSTARIFAKALICDQGPNATPCETCENCKMANENRHIDIVEMDAASSRKIDDIRELIEHTKYKPSIARYKIFIIDEVHMLTKEAFNALLKTLEEPPPYIKFILATTDPMKLPPTILSRTQHFRFKQISEQDVVNHLAHILNLENVTYEIEALHMLSRAGNGSLRDTLTLLDQAIIFSQSNITAQNLASMLGLLDPKQLESIFAAILSKDKEKILVILKELETYECEVVLDELIAYLKRAFFEQDSRFTLLLNERFFRILSEAKNLLYLNADNTFVLSLVFFKMIEAMNIKTVDDMIDELESEKFRHPGMQESAPSVQRHHDTPSIPSTPPQPEPPAQPAQKAQDDFAKLIALLKDRNLETGTCFEQSVSFISFDGQALTLSSNAPDSCRKKLRHATSIIKHFVQEVYGINTVIKMLQTKPAQKDTPSEPAAIPPQDAPLQNTPTPQEEIPSVEKKEQYDQNSGSCVAGEMMRGKEEIDAKEILSNPFMQKAQELFDPKKIEIHPKI